MTEEMAEARDPSTRQVRVGTGIDTDTYKEIAPQPGYPEESGLQVSDRDCTLQTNDRDCTLEVDRRTHAPLEVVNQTNQTNGDATSPPQDIEANSSSRSLRGRKSRFCHKGDKRKWLMGCGIFWAVIVFLVVIIPIIYKFTRNK